MRGSRHSRKGAESPGETPLLPKMCAQRRRGYGSPMSSRDNELSTNRRTAMKTIVSALIALSVLATVAAPASAFDAKSFYGQQDRQAH